MAQFSPKQLSETGKQILKAADGGDPASTVLALLKPLEQWTATEDLLRATRIGVAVSKLRTYQDQNVGAFASKLVLKWKADVRNRPGTPGSPATKGAVAAVNGTANGRSNTASPAPQQKTAPPAKKLKVDPERRNAKEDGVDTEVTTDAVRNGCIRLMYDGLSYMAEQPSSEILSSAKAVERAAFTAFKSQTSEPYKAKIRKLFQNLKMKANQSLRQGIISGKLSAERLVSMTSEELKNDARRAEDEALAKENMNKAMAAKEEKAVSTTMTCGKCRANKVAYSQAQTRSADEPMTTFCECMNCGNTWKFS